LEWVYNITEIIYNSYIIFKEKRYKMKKIFKKINTFLSLVGIAFSGYLAVRNLIRPGYCPDFFGIPACYLVLVAFLLVFLSTRMEKGAAIVFVPGGVIGFVLGMFFSIKEMFNVGICPRLFNIALCYVSLIVFAFMIILFLLYNRKKKSRVEKEEKSKKSKKEKELNDNKKQDNKSEK